jgi:hypothetical protein
MSNTPIFDELALELGYERLVAWKPAPKPVFKPSKPETPTFSFFTVKPLAQKDVAA